MTKLSRRRFLAGALGLLSGCAVLPDLEAARQDRYLKQQMAKLQLIMGGRISQETGLKSVGLDWKCAVERMMQEQIDQAKPVQVIDQEPF